jgi:crossover junction endodeoxyribonuclease RuvC
VRVLGIDPGLTRCGVGIVEGVPGRQCKLVAYFVVRSEPDEHIARRLLNLDRALTELVAEHKPESVAVERVFSQHNIRTVMGTAQASAVAILAGSRADLPVETYTPSEVKAAVTGSGTADKAQVTAMVTRLLGLDAPPRPADAADALAIAICHIWRGGTRARLQAAAVRAAAAAGAARTAVAARDAAAKRASAAARKVTAERIAAAQAAAIRDAAADRKPAADRQPVAEDAAAVRRPA